MQLGFNGDNLVFYCKDGTIQIGTFYNQCLTLLHNELLTYTFQFSASNWTIAIIFASTGRTIGQLEIEINHNWQLDWVIDGVAIKVPCQNVAIQTH